MSTPIIEIVVSRQGVEECSTETGIFVQKFVDTVGEAFAQLDGVTDEISIVEGVTEDKSQYVITISLGEADRARDAEFVAPEQEEEFDD